MLKRYSRNISTLSIEENERLKDFRVCVVGCGGIGGHVIEMLGRLGIGHITAVDYDVFEESNLNRQILSDTTLLGYSKAMAAKERMAKVNPDISVYPIVEKLDYDNGLSIIKDNNIVIDALDNVSGKLILQDIAQSANIPLIHGAIAGWYGQVTTIFPGDRTLDIIYSKKDIQGIEKKLGNPSFTPALVASIQVSEAIKLLIGRGSPLRKKILFFSLFDNEYEVVDL